jgi:short-subunit dehydrogenase
MPHSTHHRALITGASSGIGKAITLAFAKAGINLALVSRSSEKLVTVAAEAEALGVQAQVYPFDLSQIDHVKDRIQAIARECGAIDILVNNAGMGYTGDLLSTSLDDWQRVMNLNLTSVFQCIQGILPNMRDRHHGTIINVASVAAHQAFPNWGAYCVSKAGLLTLSKVLAAEERAHGIRVMTVSPGAVNTPIWDTDTVQADFNRDSMLSPDVVAQSVLHAALLPSTAVIEELVLMPSAGAL